MIRLKSRSAWARLAASHLWRLCAPIIAVATSAPFHPAAQAQQPRMQSLRLTVRPRAMALGTRNVAGKQQLNALYDSVYVPPSAVGARRVPLVLSFSGDPITRWQPMADHYGMIFVTLRERLNDVLYTQGPKDIDAVLQKVLSTYAIDPDKIALLGMSNGGPIAINLACQNLDIFSRVGLVSEVPGGFPSCADTTRPLPARMRVFATMGIGEPSIVLSPLLRMAPRVREDGHPLQLGLNLRFHVSRLKDYGNVWQWLSDTWASPETTLRTTRAVHGSDVVSLTDTALTKMTAFWQGFHQSHPATDDSDVWPTTHEKAVTIPVGTELFTAYDMLDLRSVATREATVTTNLKTANLTFAEEEEYRTALLGARATMLAKDLDAAVAVAPEVARNVAFLRTHSIAANALLDLMNVPRCDLGPQEQAEPGSCFSPNVRGVY